MRANPSGDRNPSDRTKSTDCTEFRATLESEHRLARESLDHPSEVSSDEFTDGALNV